MRAPSITALLLTIVVGLFTQCGAAQAQASRTWVSGVGDDANPCSRTAPCKTFAGAISKTQAFGEINCLDPGGFGGVTITKSIAIICQSGVAGVLVSGTNGITVNVAATDIVTLRGLEIDGLTTGLNGISFVGAGVLHVENCDIREFNSNALGSGNGINFAPTGVSELYVSDTQINDNGTQNGIGLLIRPTSSSATTTFVVSNVELNNDQTGFHLDGSAAAPQVSGTIVNTVVAGNKLGGVIANGPASSTNNMIVMLNRDVIVNNGTNGILASGQNTTIFVGSSVVTGNTNGVVANSPGIVSTYVNNQIDGNSNNGTPISSTVPLH